MVKNLVLVTQLVVESTHAQVLYLSTLSVYLYFPFHATFYFYSTAFQANMANMFLLYNIYFKYNSFSDYDFPLKNVRCAYKIQYIFKNLIRGSQTLWLLSKQQCSVGDPVMFNSQRGEIIQHHQSVKRKHVAELFFVPLPINHLMTPLIDLVNLWRDPTPMLGTTGLN